MKQGVVRMALLLLTACLAATAAWAARGISNGGFRDRDGAVHRWSIPSSHLLQWDEKPYAPVGVVFHSRYLAAPGGDTLAADEQRLNEIKSSGIADLWVNVKGGLQTRDARLVQPLIDLLEAGGFRYGFRVHDRPKSPLIGFAPALEMLPITVSELQPGKEIIRRVPSPEARRVLWVLAEIGRDDTRQNWAIASGQAIVQQGVAELRIQVPRSRLLGRSRGVLHVFPEVQVEPEDLGSYGSLWDGMDSYTDGLVKFFSQLKYGPGIRFVLDPFVAGDGSSGREDAIFPSSPQFQREFSQWLGRRFGLQTLNNRWRLSDKRLLEIEQAGRLAPAWPANDPPLGDGWLVDSTDGTAYQCQPRHSQIWTDLRNFRAEKLRALMNETANRIKKTGLDVPVIFSWAAYHPLFTNAPSASGYDGLAAEVELRPDDSSVRRAAYALAQVDEGSRTGWLIAARLHPSGTDARRFTPLEIAGGWARLRQAGYRGAYFDPEMTDDALQAAVELRRAMLAGAEGLDTPSPTLFYPAALTSSDRVAQLSTGVWWVPSVRSAKLMQYGDSLLGYEMDDPLGPEGALPRATVLWSPSGPQEITFFSSRADPVQFFDTALQPVKLKGAGRDYKKIEIGPEPLLATGLDPLGFFPVELTQQLIDELKELAAAARKKGHDVSAYETLLKDTSESLTPSSAATIYNALYAHTVTLREILLPYVWVEGERPVSHTFSSVVFQVGASSSTLLRVERDTPPRRGVYRAEYSVELKEDAGYEIWVAGLPPGQPGVSPLIWQIDEEDPVEVTRADVVSPYGDKLGWYRLGNLALPRGRHKLTLIVSGPAADPAGKPAYRAAIDAVVISSRPFTPNGAERPRLKDLEQAPPTRATRPAAPPAKPDDSKPESPKAKQKEK